jgi:eukaryotic-like serine/threonine-protein kinase
MQINLPSRYIQTSKEFQGGMGNVIVCQDQSLKRLVAIKFIRGSSHVARIQDEIRALQQIRSKHVVQILDLFIEGAGDDRCIGVVQEYVPGSDLTSLSGQNLSKNEYLKILFQIASGITDIHSQGLIHRDIKPNNMKFDQENLIKIFDFGLTRSQGIDACTLGFKGTLGFAAPELYQSGQVFFSKAVDTYAFGVTAWYLINSDLPQALLAHPPNLGSISSFSSLRGDIPNEVSNILDATLSAIPSQRPDMALVSNTIAHCLLFNRHQALLSSGKDSYLLRGVGKSVRLESPKIAVVEVKYTGLDFIISNADGEVFVNNAPVTLGNKLPGSCIITLGNPQRGAARLFVTFDVSHPEVVL